MTLLESLLPVTALFIGMLGLIGLVLAPCVYSVSPWDITRIQMTQIERGVHLYAAKHEGRFPTSDEGLAPVEGFLLSDPILDGWTRPFVYCSDGADYDLISLGRDGRIGGEHEDADLRASNGWWAQAPSGIDLSPFPSARAAAAAAKPGLALEAAGLLWLLSSCDECADETRARMSQMLAALSYLAASGDGYPEAYTWRDTLRDLDRIEHDPVDGWARPFLYCGGSQFAELHSFGRDGVRGGEGEDADLSVSSHALYRGAR